MSGDAMRRRRTTELVLADENLPAPGRLEDCEARIVGAIETAEAAFMVIGRELRTIRDEELYRREYLTFDAYCQERWGFSRVQGWRYIEAADVVDPVTKYVTQPIRTQGQALELGRLPQEDRPDAWNAAVEGTLRQGEARRLGPTIAELRGEVDRRLAPPAAPEPDPRQRRLKAACVKGGAVVANLRTDAWLIGWARAEGRYRAVDRTSDWGNPFVLGPDGERDRVVELYAEHYLPFKPSLLEQLEDLKGQVLGCWCAPERCHGDVLAERVNQW